MRADRAEADLRRRRAVAPVPVLRVDYQSATGQRYAEHAGSPRSSMRTGSGGDRGRLVELR